MLEQTDLVRKLTTLMCYLRAAHYFDDDESVEKVIVHWYYYTHTWRCTIEKRYKTGGDTEIISNDPLCKYIVDACFKPSDQVTVDVDIDPPNTHQIMEASFQLSEILGTGVNLDEILY